jgi:integrase
LHREQVSITNSGLVIDRAIDDRGKISPLKKATEEDSRSRAVIIPEITLKMLNRWLERASDCGAVSILDRFRYGLKNAGIDYETRGLTVHCLRYTYNTRMRTLLSKQVLRKFVGHRSRYHDRPLRQPDPCGTAYSLSRGTAIGGAVLGEWRVGQKPAVGIRGLPV